MIDAGTALIVVDVQNDFCSGGSLAVPGGDEIVPLVNALGKRFSTVVLTQDWHPAGHSSFASSHPGSRPFALAQMAYGPQVLWPDHCVQGSAGADFHPTLDTSLAQAVIRKGCRREVDSYSGFVEADRETPTGLAGYLRERRVSRVVVVGLATDFCVNWTAQDAVRNGFEAIVIEEACRAIDLDDSLGKAWLDLASLGVRRAAVAEFAS
ncbi:bifunctional nicotinamidase/pyrazinamidase [Bosea sp. (in: a-proteobacteria)]|uniref:bifunctional nicotinamidase/pyrazinamidase n=1 Tax=Bosea sp. (in: a-proteobacteria) TaxID=1871050 RepID=UPI002FCB3AC9